MKPQLNLHIDMADPRWSRCEGLQARVNDVLRHAYALLEEADNAAATLRFSHAEEVQTLNRDFRGKDKPTNVLSFSDGSEDDGELYLGDVIIAYNVVEQEAEEQGKSLLNHTTHMALHGLLHLLGFDHEATGEAEEMEALEIEVLAHFGIESPYS